MCIISYNIYDNNYNLDFIIMIFFLNDELCKDKENKLWFLNIFFEKRIKELLLYKKCF